MPASALWQTASYAAVHSLVCSQTSMSLRLARVQECEGYVGISLAPDAFHIILRHLGHSSFQQLNCMRGQTLHIAAGAGVFKAASDGFQADLNEWPRLRGGSRVPCCFATDSKVFLPCRACQASVSPLVTTIVSSLGRGHCCWLWEYWVLPA